MINYLAIAAYVFCIVQIVINHLQGNINRATRELLKIDGDRITKLEQDNHGDTR